MNNAAPDPRAPRLIVGELTCFVALLKYSQSCGTAVLRCLERNLLEVDVVTDDCAEHAAGHAADDGTLELVARRHCPNCCTGDAADDRVTLCVLHNAGTSPGCCARRIRAARPACRGAVDPPLGDG